MLYEGAQNSAGRETDLNNSRKALHFEAKFSLDLGHRATPGGSVR